MVSPPPQERALLDTIRRGAASTSVKRQASRGVLPVAADEMLEILVHLTTDSDPTCSETARQTLASWPAEKCTTALTHADTSAEALAYFAAQPEPPPEMVAVIAAHPNAGDAALAAVAPRLTLEQVRTLTAGEARLGERPQLVAALLQRGDLTDELRTRLQSAPAAEPEVNAVELAEALGREEESEAQAPAEEKRERVSLTQKVARMTVSERMQLALKGSRDERLILIRDPSKVVYRAVLQSPKLTDTEVEAFASMKNIADEALRIMGTSRQFLKSYSVVRNLVNNPRTPLDVSLHLLNRLTEKDMKFLSLNRNVPETVRKLALKMHKQRSAPRGSGGGGH